MNLDKAYGVGIQRIIWIYDINCKFKINFSDRCRKNRHSPLRKLYHAYLGDGIHLFYYVNVFHGFSHIASCADEHALRNAPLVGMITGEEVESNWSIIDPFQNAIREMDAGARQEAITCILLFINSEKMARMRMSYFDSHSSLQICAAERLTSHLEEARKQHSCLKRELEEMESALNEMDPTALNRYKEIYQKKGGEQFRPDTTIFTCKSSLSFKSCLTKHFHEIPHKFLRWSYSQESRSLKHPSFRTSLRSHKPASQSRQSKSLNILTIERVCFFSRFV